jgi:hypothetical protein
MTKRIITLGILAALAVAPSAVMAQGKTDFSGTWTFDEAKSDPAPAGRGGGGGGGRGGGRMGGAPATAMTIKQTATELSIDRTTAQGNQTAVYKLDGTESKNTIGPGPATSKAAWDGARIAIATTQTVQGRGGQEITVESKEIYSRDGNTLTIETTRTTPFGTQNRKLLYTKS